VTIRTGLVGYGTAGEIFHAPFLTAAKDYALDVVVTANPERAERARTRHPAAKVVPNVDELFETAPQLDLVIVASPPATHVDLAHRALDAGLAVVVDKPMCISAAEGQTLVDHAERAGAVLTVFQNRRWDGDFLTLRALVEDGRLGRVRSFESRFEWWKPAETKAWRATAAAAHGGGMLYDLGPHLLDQAIRLFGPVRDVRAELTAHRADAGADDEAFVSILHESGVRSRLWMNSMAAQVGPRFHVLGSEAAYTSWGLDPQEAALKSGQRPTDPGLGEVPEDRWGRLGIDGSLEPVPTRRGDYALFYRMLADALLRSGPLPVDPRDSVAVIALIEAIHSGFPVRHSN
jgi:predicted dehydrogenase